MTQFAAELIGWYTERKRALPWRKTKNPYPVWLSEIILQQTRVEQGLPYWQRFMEEFPTVHDLANADVEHVLRLWQGLGYYSRARNLHLTAKHISTVLGGSFPNNYNAIIRLKGIGPYTAAAIASICFGEATPVVDGNVFRFASRYFGILEDITSSKARGIFENRLLQEIDKERPGNFNQAMMEFGATVCTPQPKCLSCVFQPTCYGFSNGLEKELPIKTRKTKVSTRYFNYISFKYEEQYLLKQRSAKDVWQGLFDFHLEEGKLSEEKLIEKITLSLKLRGTVLIQERFGEFKHLLSHQKILARFYEVDLSLAQRNTVLQKTELSSYSVEELLNLPKPKLIVNYLTQLGIKEN